MKKNVSAIFSKESLKNIPEGLKDQIIQRFNDYDTMQRVMQSVSNNLKTLVSTSNGLEDRDKTDIVYLSNLLRQATNVQWLKENNLFY